jgi:hypothetical protein
MNFKFPKTANGKKFATANYDFLLPVTLNETNIERMLIQILERVVKEGKSSPPHTNATDKLELKEIINRLQANANLQNFDGVVGEAILAGWIRTVLVEMITVTKNKTGEQIDYLRPLTIAAYRAGLPRQRSRHRKVDQLVYRSMLSYWLTNEGRTRDTLRTALVENTSLGKGLKFPPATYPYTNPEYSGDESVDINALLELRLLEGIKGRDPRIEGVLSKQDSQPLQSPVPDATSAMGKHLVDFLISYNHWSPAELTTSLTCILALDLFQMPLRAAAIVRETLASGYPAEGEPDARVPLQMYFDFTMDAGSHSDKLSKYCVERDLQSLASFFSDMILIRETEASASILREYREELDKLEPTMKLARLADLVKDPNVHAAAGMRLEAIESELELEGAEASLYQLSEVRRSTENYLQALVALVIEDRQTEALGGLRKWSYSTGGLVSSGARREHALLSGTMKAPTTWKYVMTEPMLLTLVSLCFLDDKGRTPTSRSLEMRTLLARLESRFGVLINKPPTGLDTPEARAGAAANYAAFTRTLKILGYFEGLSDDFSAQFVTRPEGGAR